MLRVVVVVLPSPTFFSGGLVLFGEDLSGVAVVGGGVTLACPCWQGAAAYRLSESPLIMNGGALVFIFMHRSSTRTVYDGLLFTCDIPVQLDRVRYCMSRDQNNTETISSMSHQATTTESLSAS